MARPADIEDIYPLSPMQQGMLFHALKDPGSGVYVEQMDCNVAAPVDVAAFVSAWQRSLRQHSVLRSCFAWDDSPEPVQIVMRDVQLPFEYLDWSAHNNAHQESQLQELLRQQRAEGFDLRKSPLLRLTLIRQANECYRFVWTYHHLVLDGWSTASLLAEVFRNYTRLIQGALPEPVSERPYRDYIAHLCQQDVKRAEVFWRNELAGFLRPTPLPGSASTACSDKERYCDQTIGLSTSCTEALQQSARHHGVSLNTLAQAAWAVLLARYCGEPEVLFGIVSAGRPAELKGIEETVGLFIKTLPLRLTVPTSQSLSVWLKEIQQKQIKLQEFEFASLAQMQAWSDVAPPQPLFHTLLVFENYPVQSMLGRLRELHRVDDVHLFESTSYPLAILVQPGQALAVRALFHPDQIDHESVNRILSQYARLLAKLAEGADILPASVLLPDSAQHKQLHNWNATERSTHRSGGVHELFERNAAILADQPAAISGKEQITYAELNHKAEIACSGLRAAGVKPGAVVGLCMDRSLDAVVGILAILKSAAAYLPLDPSYPEQRLAFMLDDAEVEIILTHTACSKMPPFPTGKLLFLDALLQEAAVQAAPRVTISSDRMAYVLYTSGSTGRPKGVAMSHRALLNLLEWQSRQSARFSRPRTLQFAPLSFDVSFQEIFSTLNDGGTLVLPSADTRRNPELLWQLLREEQIERVFLPFVALRQLATAAESLEDLPDTLAQVITAGEQLQITPAIRKLFQRLAGCELHNQYGPTESHVVTCFHLTGSAETWPTLPPIGRPIDNAQIYILNPQMKPVPIGAIGELYIGGVCLAEGYFRRPDLTAERFALHTCDDESVRLYRTGDLAKHRNDGNIEFVGRCDDQIKIRGHRVELGEIETTLSKFPGIDDSAVVASSNEDGQRRLVAFVIGRKHIDASELRAHLSTSLPEYMVPGAFVALASLPLTPSGKVDRCALTRIPTTSSDRATPSAAPRHVVQELVAEMYADVLSLSRVGIHDNFFTAGGHSLLATQLISRLRTALNLSIPLQWIFESPTVEALAERIVSLQSGDASAEWAPIIRQTAEVEHQLSFAQERMWFFDQLAPGTSDYNIALRVRITGSLSIDVLERTLHEIVRRHEILRTRYRCIEGRPTCTVSGEENVQIEVVDLRQTPFNRDQSERIALAEAKNGFDLSNDIPLRVLALRLEDGEYLLLVTMHHIAFDGWSLGILTKEVSTLYNAYLNGEDSPHTELALQYSDYAAWQRHLVHDDFVRREIGYWQDVLEGAPRTLDLPLDHPRSQLAEGRSAAHRFTLDSRLSATLRCLSREAGATPFMTLLTALHTLLHRYTQQETIVIGSPVANRHRLETEPLIGCFINPLPLRCDVSPDISFFDLLLQVRDRTISAYSHQDLPFERIVQELAPDRDLSRTPLFQVMFVFQNFPLEMPNIPGLALKVESVETYNSVFDLTLTVWEESDAFAGLMEYNSSLFESNTVSRMLDHFRNLLQSALNDPEQRACELQMFSDAEKQRMIVDWDCTSTPEKAACVYREFEEQAGRTPQACAIVCGGQSLTYAELNARANRLSRHLRQLGVAPESMVAQLMDRSIEAVIGILAIMKAGAVYVPIDPAYPKSRLEFLLKDSGAGVVITHSQWANHLDAQNVRTICCDRELTILESQSGTNLEDGPTPESPAYLMYTSGSTGTPKGVLVEHAALRNYVEAACKAYAMSHQDRVLQFASLSFDASLEEIFPTLVSGGTVVLRGNGAPDAVPDFISACDEGKITVLSLPTAYWHEWAAQLDILDKAVPECLRLVILGGEKAARERVVAWRSRVPESVRLLNTYGPTEATIISTLFDISAESDAAAKDERVPIGRPICNVSAYILDVRKNPVPVGVRGELYVGGAGIARGYWKRPELTARHFLPNPFSRNRGDRLYRTGDLARYLPDGNIEFLGRADDQVKLRGHRIELGEIEAVLMQHLQVRDAGCTVQDGQLFAYVAVAPESALNSSALFDFLRQKLPVYMLPAQIVIVDAVPRTSTGKLDRAELSCRIPNPANPIPAGTDVEQSLCAICKELLKVDDLGIHDNFFELGGHSLAAVQLVSRIQRQLGVALPVRTVFHAGTVAGLAKEILRLRALNKSGEDSTIEFDREALLDPMIVPADAASSTPPERIFLTGATGVLGPFLLSEILKQTDADVHCLVRATSAISGKQRILDSIRAVGLWRDSFLHRIIAVQGDLTASRFGLNHDEFGLLTQEMDAVYHNGAAVNALFAYSDLKPANVGGTHEAIRLASSNRRKPMHIISTLSVFSSQNAGAFDEDTDVSRLPVPRGGYAQSKWVAERLAMISRSRGLEVVTYRPGRIMGWSDQSDRYSGLLAELLQACLQIGSVPEMELLLDVTPVHYVAAAIVHISRQTSSVGKAFHLNHPNPVPWNSILRMLPPLGFSFEIVSYKTWLEKLSEFLKSNTRFPQLNMLLVEDDLPANGAGAQAPTASISCRNTLNALAGSGIECLPLDERFLKMNFDRFFRHGDVLSNAGN
jgi:amino acid adenylation domain-containing protein/thioester reductase-like protein